MRVVGSEGTVSRGAALRRGGTVGVGVVLGGGKGWGFRM